MAFKRHSPDSVFFFLLVVCLASVTVLCADDSKFQSADVTDSKSSQRQKNVAPPCGGSTHDKADDKRDWGKNGMRAWGKRSDAEAEAGEGEKRAWSKSGLRVWGKREDGGKEGEKRKWGDSKMRMWGKRNSEEEEKEEEKRAWSKNSVRVWGKRVKNAEESGKNRASSVVESEEGEREEEKRNWGNSQLRAWGKRKDDETPEAEDISSKVKNDDGSERSRSRSKAKREIDDGDSRPKRSSWSTDWNRVNSYYPPEGPKRSWRTNVIRVWGKRMAPPY